MKFLRASVAAAVPLVFLAYVFQMFTTQFWNAGLAHWLDPYFINALLEHWYVSLRNGTDPSSPPMYFPVEKTMGYSHGLVLFALFYVPLRLFLHPFLAYNWTVVLVLASGVASLHVLFRKLGLTRVESLTLGLLFLTSRNVINEQLSEWTQRASVFLIPPILLLLHVSVRVTKWWPRIGLAAFGGFLSILMYVQDFYTAHFAMLFVAAFTVAAVFVKEGVSRPSPWLIAVTIGGAAGAVVFLWIYLPAYVEHRAFPEDQLLRQLLFRDPTRWTNPLDLLRDLAAYDTPRSFIFVLVVAVLLWIPRVTAARKPRLYWMWFLAFSLVVVLIPLRVGEFSVWRMLIEPLPGFGIIRDPKRIVYVYELVAVLATAGLVTSFPPSSAFRSVVIALAILLVVTDRAPSPFRYRRSIAVFDRWVGRPITLDPSCRSFYIKGASAEYMSRSNHMWSEYGLDSLFVSFRLRIPTLNGYSAWAPEGWELANPQEPGYGEAVTRWIERYKLTDVCEFDIDARRMTRRAG
jgi:hypothetical protein